MLSERQLCWALCLGLHRLDFHSFTNLGGQHFRCSFTLKAEVGYFFPFIIKINYNF